MSFLSSYPWNENFKKVHINTHSTLKIIKDSKSLLDILKEDIKIYKKQVQYYNKKIKKINLNLWLRKKYELIVKMIS